MNVSISPYLPIGSHTSNSSLSAATSITVPSNASGILAQALTQNVRFTLDGTTPTATLGFQLKAGDPPLLIPVGPGRTVRLIEETATANLQYQAVRTADTER